MSWGEGDCLRIERINVSGYKRSVHKLAEIFEKKFFEQGALSSSGYYADENYSASRGCSCISWSKVAVPVAHTYYIHLILAS